MSSEVIISVTDLGKCYPIYDRPRDRLLQMLLRGRRTLFREFWALRGVSFTVKRGETIAIIGRNGSGKSTLLQILCGTLNPTVGQVKVRGKVAALLELGAGFNPEFSGRENVYMAASLYGLTKDQIDERFERIVEFADIGDHLDQPVKTYSSGMYVRLAFAVIAHVDADILVIDEALAVGDAVFTQKCMRFIREFQKNGTLIFVSHDMSSVLNLCKTAIWLFKGKVVQHGDAKTVSEAYLQYTLQEIYGEEAQLTSINAGEPTDEEREKDSEDTTKSYVDYSSSAHVVNNLSSANGWKSGGAEITEVAFTTMGNRDGRVLKGGERVVITITAKANQTLNSPMLGFIVKDRLGQDLFGENTLVRTESESIPLYKGEKVRAEFHFTLPMLPNGSYSVLASIADGDLYNNVQHHWLHDALILTVSSSKVRWGLVGVNFDNIILRKLV